MGMYSSHMQGDAAGAEVACTIGESSWWIGIRWGALHRVTIAGTADELERIGADIVAAVARVRAEHEAQVAANPPLDLDVEPAEAVLR